MTLKGWRVVKPQHNQSISVRHINSVFYVAFLLLGGHFLDT